MAEKVYYTLNGKRIEAKGDMKAQILADRAEAKAADEANAAEEQARAETKASAVAKLQALGLTVEEVQVAFGLEA